MFIKHPKDILSARHEFKEFSPRIYLIITEYLFLWFLKTTQETFLNSKKVTCNICGWQGNGFFPDIVNERLDKDKLCPHCTSQPKDRNLKWFLDHENISYQHKSILDIAPSRCLLEYFKNKKTIDYVAIDLYPNSENILKMDLTKLTFPNASFDLVFCFNVLEHVDDDRKALKEIKRVLKQRGQVILSVPINNDLEKTVEYTEPDKRDSFHRREYGKDFSERVESIGFNVLKTNWSSYFSSTEKHQYGLRAGEFYILKLI